MTIVEAIAWIEDVDRMNLPPLYDAIDTERLNGLFGRSPAGVLYRSSSKLESADNHVSFEYEGYDIEVNSDEITIRPL